ncbi:hypothetical protein [Glycomyces paridis]|uniref:Uncharacterized protein n=1 Tax=Glycomyces paridis TaxID=2126555 RepID=A0A4S8PM97_9ACTN|nr:hypothetical protein [Glycomyces paridis]THV29649.1 hypothetical protein E9998_09200 [Glycomyces paridis]
MTKIRIIGLPSEAQQVVTQLSRLLPVQFVSEPKPCRRTGDRGKVRIYVYVGIDHCGGEGATR